MSHRVHRISLARAWRIEPCEAVPCGGTHSENTPVPPAEPNPDADRLPGLEGADAEPPQRLVMVRAFHQPSGLIGPSKVRLRWLSRTPEQVRLAAFWLNDCALPLRHRAAEYDWEIGAELKPSNRIRLVIECVGPTAIEPSAASLNLSAERWPFDLWLEISET